MENEIKLTNTSVIVEMTKALSEIPCGAKPVVYEQVVDAKAGDYGRPDPAHND